MRLHRACSEELIKKIHDLYMEAFPKEERKPFEMILKLQKEGRAAVYAIEESDNLFVGLGIFVLYNDLALLDYFAIEKNYRGRGMGSAAIQLLQNQYPDKRFFLEIESTCDDLKENTAEKEVRMRRKKFYMKNGMRPLDFLIKLFGVEMEMLVYGETVTFEEYFELYGSILPGQMLTNVQYLGDIRE